MNSPPPGHCCVCGRDTTTRCSACLEAGIDLFFCSREHQKLVYFAHKKVCGKNAKPFRFPPLSWAEAGEAEAGGLEVLGVDDGQAGPVPGYRWFTPEELQALQQWRAPKAA
ncbi:hypothetical protein JCM6882_009738 [Rhodosporidiobolus microsporus]